MKDIKSVGRMAKIAARRKLCAYLGGVRLWSVPAFRDALHVLSDWRAEEAIAHKRSARADALREAAEIARNEATINRHLNRQIREKPNYDEHGPDGDCAHFEAAMADRCDAIAAAIEARIGDAGDGGGA